MNSAPKNKWLQPGFLIVVAILGLSAVGLNSAVAMWKLYFIKQAVPLRRELTAIPPELAVADRPQAGDWVQVSRDEPLLHEMQDTLGTDKYIFRDYVNLKAIDWSDLASLGARRSDQSRSLRDTLLALFAGKGSLECKQIVGALQTIKPQAVVSLAVTYYTGKVDTVAHIPERCETADGYEPTDPPATLLWDVNSSKTPDGQVYVRFINFVDRAGMSRVTKNVAYFFHANGAYKSDAIAVRMSLQDLWQKYAYYAKVELMTTCKDPERAKAVMRDFLSCALPEIEKTYPDASKYFAH